MEVENKCQETVSNTIEDDTNTEFLQTSVDNIIRKEGYKSHSVTKRQISTKGGSYLGLLYEFDVKGETGGGKQETNLFVKNITPITDNKLMSVTDAYKKEHYFYNELSIIFTDLQDEANVPQEDRYKMPKGYDESTTETIILENLSKKGFKTGHRMEVMSIKFAELSVEHLAKFHGLSYVLQIRRPEYFELKLKTMKHPFFFNDEFNESLENMYQLSCQPLDNTVKRKVELNVPKFTENYRLYVEDTVSPGCCICHGDYRINNVLVKETNEVPTEVVPVDYQLLHYGHPLNDFFFFIFTGTDQDFRKHHLYNLKELYYDSLAKYLRHFNIDAEFVHPRREFERMFKEKLEYGLLTALFGSPFIFAEENDTVDLSQVNTTSVRMNKKFEDRIRGIVDDFIQWGYL